MESNARPMTGSATQPDTSFRDGALAPDPESRDSGFDASQRPGMTASPSIHLHIFLRDDRVRRKSLVDKTLLLQPRDLVVDVPDVEFAVRVDISAIADHLLDRQIGVFGDDLQQRFCLVVDMGLAIL